MLKTRENIEGYLEITVPPLHSRYPVSRAIWIGATLTVPVFDDLEVDHINGNRQDNRFKNLRLLTHAGNKRCGRRQILYEEAEAMRREYEKGGVTLKELAERCGRGIPTVRRIVRGETFTKPAAANCSRNKTPLDYKLKYGVFKEICLEGKRPDYVLNKYKITRETLRMIIEEQSLIAEQLPEDAAEQQEAAA